MNTEFLAKQDNAASYSRCGKVGTKCDNSDNPWLLSPSASSLLEENSYHVLDRISCKSPDRSHLEASRVVSTDSLVSQVASVLSHF